jgi:hypothetical protein
MFRQGVRRFTTTAFRAAETAAQMEARNAYGVKVSRAQGAVNGLTEGMLFYVSVWFPPKFDGGTFISCF